MTVPTRSAQVVEFSFQFRHSCDKVWPLFSNTDRINRAAGLSAIQYRHEPRATGGSTRYGKLRKMEWIEHPYEWERPSHYRYVRTYFAGPFKEVITSARLVPTAGGCRAEMRIEVEPRSRLLGRIVRHFVRRAIEPGFIRSWEEIDRFLSEEGAVSPFPALPVDQPRLQMPAIEAMKDRLSRSGIEPRLQSRICELVATGQEPDLIRIRPFALAKSWKEDPVAVLRSLLKSTKSGLFNLSWDLICPGCRGAKTRVGALADVGAGGHCDACNIDFGVALDESVEISFSVHPGVRPITAREFCVGGPQNTPHALAQKRIAEGGSAELELDLAVGIYLIRSHRSCSRHTLEICESGDAGPVSLKFDTNAGVKLKRRPGKIRFKLSNEIPGENVATIERAKWQEDACTGAFLTTLQEFRDAFSSEVLRPGQEITVGAVALLFTDLKGSTAMYQKIGDATAYRLVREHFDILMECVRRNNGGIVKTIGDAVMASFHRPEDAVRAAIGMQEGIEENNTRRGPSEKLKVKVGIHYGPCYAVNMNERLDYFGASVNIAARTEGQCEGGEIVVTQVVYDDPSVRELISSKGLNATRFMRSLKGFEQEFELYKIPCIGYSREYGQSPRSA